MQDRNWVDRLLEIGLPALGLAIVVLVPVYHGLDRFFLASVDPDLDFSYQALTLNAGEALRYHTHSGFGYVLILAGWLKLVHGLGLIEISSITPLIASDRFVALYSQVVIAGRVLSILLAVAALLVIWWLTRLLSRSTLAAGLAAFVSAAGFGFQTQYVVLRTELPAMIFILLAAVFLVLAARRGRWTAVFLIGLAAAAVVYAIMIKFQVFLVSLFLPPLAILATENPKAPVRGPAPGAGALAAITLGAGLVSYDAAQRWTEALLQGEMVAYKIAIAVYVAACAVIYARLTRCSWRWLWAASMAAVSRGENFARRC